MIPALGAGCSDYIIAPITPATTHCLKHCQKYTICSFLDSHNSDNLFYLRCSKNTHRDNWRKSQAVVLFEANVIGLIQSINPLSPHDALKHHFTSPKTGVLERKFPETGLPIHGNFLYFSPTSNHLHSLQVENCDSNLRLVVHEDDNGKFRLERVKHNVFQRCLGFVENRPTLFQWLDVWSNVIWAGAVIWK